MAMPNGWVRFFCILLVFLVWESAKGVRGGCSTTLPPFAAPMVLPLFFSPANSSRPQEHGDLWRRELRKERAHMKLHDGTVSRGYYSTKVYIGTPPKKFTLIVDSGSTVTYVPCSTCSHCGIHQDPRFHPHLSSTYKPLKCDMSCNCDKEKNQCMYERKYAEMSSSSGVLGEDFISFGEKGSLKPQRIVFGCENKETGQLFSQNADGIIGLGRSQLSIMDQLVSKGVISDSFSLCFGGIDIGGGVMILGDVPPPHGMVFSHSNPARSSYYNIELKSIYVSGHPLRLKPSIFNGNHGTILDSGTTFAYLPKEAFIAFKNAIIKHLKSPKQITGADPNIKDVCFSGFGSDVSKLPKSFPDVDMVFNNGQRISLSPENYLFRHLKVPGAYCLGIFASEEDSSTLLGGIIVRNMLVSYDRKNNRIGFWKTNCVKLFERIKDTQVHSEHNNSSTVAVSPAPSQHQNSTTGHSQNDSHTDETQIGFILLDIYFSIKYSDLAFNVRELTEVMSHNVEVSPSQIQILSITSTSKGNGSIIRWKILPEESTGFISKSTAMAIIYRLTEHSFHLPEKFGTYQLLDWKLEPLSTRTRWQRHIFALVLGTLLVLIFASSVLLGWYWYKRRHGAGAYRPVDAPSPVQELQTF